MLRALPGKETVQLAGYTVELSRKRIKNLILRVGSPEGRLRLSIPLRCPLAQAEAFIRSRREWIESQSDKLRERAGQLTRAYANGERTYLWGKAYELRYPGRGDPEKALYRFYRAELRRAVEERLPLWQERLGLEAEGWHIRRMKSRWGSCQIQKRELTINLELTRYPLELLDYILVHELTHLYEPSHNRKFYAFMDRAMPDWKARRRQLRQPLPHEGELLSSPAEDRRRNQHQEAAKRSDLDVDKIRPLLII